MTTRQRVAAKYVSMVDRVEERGPVPVLVPEVQVREVRNIVPIRVVHQVMRNVVWDDFDDRTLADLVGTGLVGQ